VRSLGLLLVALSLATCGGHAIGPGGSGSGNPACALDPTGSFVFHVHNAGTGPITLDLGCGRRPPIELTTPAGSAGIGPGSGDQCEFTCDQVFGGHTTPGACSDCGPGVTKTLAPGETFDVTWDRRVYTRRAAAPPCSTGTGNCAFGSAVAPTTAQAGAITTCPAALQQTGACLAITTTEFTVDTTGSDATIDVP
jgi:hypothetical protein